MSGAKNYEDSTRRQAIDAVHVAMRQLREHGWSSVSIDCHRVDAEGCTQSYELDFDEDDDDDDDKETKP